MAKAEYVELLMGMGISDVDADTLYDCIITKEVCTWTSCDLIPEDTERKLNDYLKQYGLTVKITPLSTRGRFIWRVEKITRRN